MFSVDKINQHVIAMNATLGGRRINGLDLEWKVMFHRQGMGSSDKVAVMQVCFVDTEGQEHVLVFMIQTVLTNITS